MKYSILLILIIIFLGNCYVNCQKKDTVSPPKYFYYKGSKKYLEESIKKIFVTFKSGLLEENNKYFLKKYGKECRPDYFDKKANIHSIKYYFTGDQQQLYTLLVNSKNENNIACIYPAYAFVDDEYGQKRAELKNEDEYVYVLNKVIFEKKTSISILQINNFLQNYNTTISGIYPMGHNSEIIVATLNGNENVFDVANSLFESGLAEFSQPNFVKRVSIKEPENSIDRTIYENKNNKLNDDPGFEPNDELFWLEWHLKNTAYPGNDIHAPEAWSKEKGENIIVAILDGQACDITHPDFQGKFIYPWNSNLRNENVLPRNGNQDKHLTRIAGFVGAATNNEIGVASVGFNNYFMPVVMGHNPTWIGGPSWDFDDEDFINACSYIFMHSNDDYMPIVAVSCSWMWSYFNNNQVFETALRDINDNGRNGRGVHIVFCSMNDNDEKIPYPAKLDFCIAVGGSNLLDDRYHFGSIDGSNYGPDLEMVAPATDLESTDNTLNYGGTTGYVYRITGTSYSAPQVAAALGLMYSYNRTLRHSDALYNLLHYGVDKVGGNYNQNHTYGSWDYEMGYGRLNLVKCVNYIEHIPYSICINENITIGLGQNAIYAAFHSITLPCDNPYTFSVLSGGICLLASGNSIILNPGFSAADGSTFFAYIEPSYNLNKTNTQIYQPSFYLSNYLTEKSLKKELVPQYFLNQNYPNPFNPLTSIKYSIEMEGNVTIKVYDILGRLVATLVNEYKKAGIYDIQFDGTNFASGLYIYQIKSGNFVSNKKMVLVK